MYLVIKFSEMKKVLILIRHAKSDWSYPIDDKQRSLTSGGIEAIQKVGILAKELVTQDMTIWSSTAVRARETAFGFCKAAALDSTKIVFKDSLYTFNEQHLEKEIKKCDNIVNKLILFGHNEAITNFVNKFGDKLIMNVPTSGFVFLQFEQDCWENINHGKTVKTIFPKEI